LFASGIRLSGLVRPAEVEYFTSVPQDRSGQLKAPDGREYPPHLHVYHKYDAELLPLVERLQPVSFDELGSAVVDRDTRAVLPNWLSSARWRGLVDIEDAAQGTRRYVRRREGAVSAA
jgi:hypothetical protein